MLSSFRFPLRAGLYVLLLGASAFGQWSSDPFNNLSLADRTNEQVQPKVRATADGGCYVSWFDNFSGGYDVYLQRLDAAGFEQWPHNGVLIADRAVSSTVDYDLIVDADGNAVITYNDDGGISGGPQQIAVNKVSPAGVKLWGATGVTISSGTAFKANPRVVQLSTGEYVVGYSTGSPQFWVMQKLDTNGVPQFADPGVSVTEASHYLALSDMQPALNGEFIALWVRGSTTNPITSSKALYTQKYDSSGVAQWNAGAPVIVFNATSIQNGYFPTFLPDGNGGAVHGWYEIGGARNAYIQHVLPNGTLKFPAPGIANTGSTPGRIRIGAGLAYNAASGDYFLASPESDASPQGNYTCIVNRIDSSGTRQWGNDGAQVVGPSGSNQTSFVQCQTVGDGTYVFGLLAQSSTTHVVFGSRVNCDGTIAWSNLPSATIAPKSRLSTALSTQGFAMLAFGNGATGAVDIQAQNVNPDGSFGYAPPPVVTIASANPPAAAGNPYAPGQPYRDVLDTGTDNTLSAGIGGAGTQRQGGIEYAEISVTLSAAPVSTPSLCNTHISCTGGNCPTVTSVSGSGTGPYTITLSGVIPPLECTTLTFVGATSDKLQYQSAPGDLNLDGAANTLDLLWLVQRLNDGTANQAANLARYNVDRSAGASPVNTTDLLRLVQLLNGVNTTQVFNGSSVAPCP